MNMSSRKKQSPEKPIERAMNQAAGQLRQSLTSNVGSVLSEELATGIMAKYAEAAGAALRSVQEEGNVGDQ